MDIENTVYPLSRYWYSGDFRFYYAYGNTPPQDFLQNCSGVDNPAILVLGCGDIRSCFYSLWKNFDIKGPARFSGVEFVLNDISAAVLARDILFLYLCLHLPEEETALKKWLSGMWAIWYCHELFPDHNKLLNDSLHDLCKYSKDWSNDGNSLFPLVKFSSPTTLKEVGKIWKMWLHRKVKVASVKEMHSSRQANFIKYDGFLETDASVSAFVEDVTEMPFEKSIDAYKLDLMKSEVLAYIEKGNVYAEIVLDLYSSILEPTVLSSECVNITLFENEDGMYTLHHRSLPFRCYFHTIEFKYEPIKFFGTTLHNKLLVPDKYFNLFPLLANSVQQFCLWVQSTHYVFKSGHKISFTFNCSHVLNYCYELQNEGLSGFPKYDMIYASSLVDDLSPPNLILSAIPLLKDDGLLFTSTLFKKKFGTLNQYITSSFGFDCKYMPIVLGIRCINHEGDSYASPVAVQPCPLTEKRTNYVYHEDLLIWEKVKPGTIPLVFSQGEQLPEVIVKVLLSSVQIFVYPLIIPPKVPMVMCNSCVETAVKCFQVLMSNVCAEFSPHFWQPLSDAMQVSIKPYLQCMQTQLILHGIHIHLTVSEDGCPMCLNQSVSNYAGLFSIHSEINIDTSSKFMAIVHKETLDDAAFLCELAKNDGDVHIFDCVGIDDSDALQLFFYAPLDLPKQEYKVTTVMSSTSDFGSFTSSIADLPTQSLKKCQTSFSSFKFFQAASSNFNHILKSFGVITSHGSDGDSCDTEIDLCPEVISRFGIDKIEPKKVSSNILQLSFGESTCQLKYSFPVAYDSIKIRLRRKKGSVLVLCPRTFQDFISEKPLFTINPDKELSLFPLLMSQDAISLLSLQQFTMQELKSIQSLGLDNNELHPLVKVKKLILKIFQDETYFFRLIQPNGEVICLFIVNSRLFNYQDLIPVVDLAFCFVEDLTLDTLLPPWESIPPQQLCSIEVDEADCKLIKQVFLYFSKRTNGDCNSVGDSKCHFNWLVEKKVEQYFTRAVISLLLSDVDHFSYVLKEQPDLLQELFPTSEPEVVQEKCDYCGKLSARCLKKCSKCKGVKYCDEKCQQAHWNTHKSVCKETDSHAKHKADVSRPFPIARFWYGGEFRYYYPYGNTTAEDFLENCTDIKEPQILSLGCGDMRSYFYTLWKHFDFSISQAPRRFEGAHFVLNDNSAAVQARNIAFLYLCLHLPSTIEERKRWLCAMWAIWYCHELHWQHQSVLDNCLRALLKYSNSIDQWKQADNPLSHLVKFTSPAVLSEISKAWKLWLERKMGVSSVDQMHLSRYKELEKKGVLNKVESIAIGFTIVSTCIFSSKKAPSKNLDEVIEFIKSGNCFAEEVLDLDLQAIPTTVNLTLYEKPSGVYSLHYGSNPFSGYYHTVEFSPHTMKSAGIQMRCYESMLVPTEKFKSLPFLSNSVQQFSMWIQSAHEVLSRKSNRQKFSFTFNTLDALIFCQELSHHDGNCQFDLIYTSNLIDHLSIPNLILSAILLLKDSGLLFSSSLLYKNFASNLDEFLNICFGFDCELLPILLGIRCINHEGGNYASTVVTEPLPVHTGDIIKTGRHEKKLIFQKVCGQSLLLPKLPPLENGNITDAMFGSVKVSVCSLIAGSGEGIMLVNNQCSETAVLILQTFASTLNANVGDYRFWEPLSSALYHSIKPHLHSLQAQLLLHKLHMHLVVDQANCPLCKQTPTESYLGAFCAEIPLPIDCLTPSFLALVHQYSSSDAVYLLKEATSGKDVHIFDCFDGTVENETLKLKFFAPKKFVESDYNVTIALSYMTKKNIIVSCLPTTRLRDLKINFLHYIFSPISGLSQTISEDTSFGKLTCHVGDGDRMHSEILLSDAAKIASSRHKLITTKISSDTIKLAFGKFIYRLNFKYPINYNGISIKFFKSQGIITIVSPRHAYEFTEEKPMFITSPDHQLSLPPQHLKDQIMDAIMISHSGLQMTKEERRIQDACDRQRALMPPLLNVKEKLMFFFQSKDTYLNYVTSRKDFHCVFVVVNQRLFDYQHKAPAVDLAFHFVNASSIEAMCVLNHKITIRNVIVGDADKDLLKKTLTYFAGRTNGTCRTARKPNKFQLLQQHKIDRYFTRAVVYLLYNDPEQCGMNILENPESKMAEEFQTHKVVPPPPVHLATDPKCQYCNKHCPSAKKCTGCKKVQYCSKDCQAKHWPVHSKDCKVAAQSRTTGESVKSIDVKPSAANKAVKPTGAMAKCSYCNKGSDHLKKCKQCGVALYCDSECQRSHWPQHKSGCKAAPKARSLAGSLSAESEYRASATANSPISSRQGQSLERCAYCGSCSAKLKACARCGKTKYCGKDCQGKHWTDHKYYCN